MQIAFRTLVVFLVACALLQPASAPATTIDPLLFEEMVLGADFVGIVECMQAGGIVAKYKIVESWKGPKPGTEISIRVAVNYWEPQFPLTLCGERYFVTAYKEAPSRVVSTTGGGGVPLWWRNIPADYRLPLFQGRELLTPEQEKGPEFEKTRKAAQKLLALKPGEQEAALLKAVIENDLFSKRWIGGEPDERKARELQTRLSKLAAADAIVGDLVQLAKGEPKKWGVRVRIVLGKAGGAETRKLLEKIGPAGSPWEKEELDGLVQEIKQRRERGETPKAPKEVKDADVPSPEKLASLRKTLSEGMEAEGFGEAFQSSMNHDPGPVADFLIAWKNPKKDWRDADRGYMLGSFFAWRCGKDRKKHLTALLDAKDPFVRTAGAVYLCYEDVETGTTALKKLTTLEGDAGVWAALALARRGNKDALPRALEVFREEPEEQKVEQAGMAGVPHKNLQKRVLELLSNSAKEAGVPQPVLPEMEGKQLKYLADWWKQHGDKAVLQDPWLKLLEKQKVD